MADQKLTQLTALASLSADDLFYVVDDPAGAANQRKMAASVLDGRYLQASNNLSDLVNVAAAQSNLGLGSLAPLSSMTLADVAGYSTTTAHQTFALNVGTNVVFEQADGDDILILYESNQGVQAKAHAAIGGAAGINTTINDAGLPNEVVLSVSESMTDFTNPYNNIGIFTDIELNPTAQFGSYVYVGWSSVRTKNTCTVPFPYIAGVFGAANHFGSGLVDDLVGLEYSVGNYGAGGVTRATALNVFVGNFGSSGTTIGTAIGAKIQDAQKSAGAIITTVIGLDIANQSIGVNNFAIRTKAGHIVFNEDSNDDTDFRVEGATDAHLLFTDGSADRVGINDSTPDGKLDIVQSSTTAAIPVVELEQLDLSEEFFNFVGTVATGNPIEAVGAKTLTTTHFIRVAVNGSFLYFPVGTIA